MKTEKTVSPAVLQLKAQLEASKKQVAATKLMLKQIQDQNKTPFEQTKVGKAYLTTLRVVTSPFAALYGKASTALEDPNGFRAEQMTEEALNLLVKSGKLLDNKHPKARLFAVRLAKLALNLQAFNAKTDNKFANVGSALRNVEAEIARLRPDINQVEMADLQAQAKKMAEQIIKDHPEMAETLKEIKAAQEAAVVSEVSDQAKE
jgi:hypothetical protein